MRPARGLKRTSTEAFKEWGSLNSSGSSRGDRRQGEPNAGDDNNGGCSDTDSSGRDSGIGSNAHDSNRPTPE